ncbi:universal stress protein [Variovorax sp. H27-G14]|uniref:universal stress protein n=1 Tax=Variovorax sp. H27-G14 TaxID=3111914 RepID=UPI0038FC7B38
MTSTFDSIVAAVDMSPESPQIVYRAAMLALKHGVALKVMDISSLVAPSRAPRASELKAIATSAVDGLGVLANVLPDRATRVSDIAEATRRSIVVLKHERRPGLRSLWRGSLAEQLIRVGDSPVLILKAQPNARENYERLLVAVDLSYSATHLIALACHLEENSELQILHSIRPLHSNPLRDAEMPDRILRAYLLRRKLEAHEQLLRIAGSARRHNRRVTTVLRDGDPAWHATLQQSHAGADLVVVGKRRSCALLDLLCGSVAKRILVWCAADVLVVPCHSPHPKTAPARSSAIASN